MLVNNVSNGTLNLAADGSFTYTPNNGFAEVDSFTYKANDGYSNSDVATVIISVGSVAELTVTEIDPNNAQAGTTINVTISGSGFVNNASVRFEGGSGPAPLASNIIVHDETSLSATVTIRSGGPQRVRIWSVRITNTDNSSAVLPASFTVNP